MSHSKNTHIKNHYQQRDQYPLIKPPYVNRINNQERLKEVYKSVSVKQKEKSKQKNAPKFYLPLHDKKIIENNVSNTKKSTNGYRAYLQGEEGDEHYQQYSQRYQPKDTNRYGQSQQSKKNERSTNLQLKVNFRRKIYNQLQNHSLTSRHKQSTQILQNQLYQLNKNFTKNKNHTKHNISNLLQQQNASTRHNANGRYEQTQYQRQVVSNIRRSTKKSFSGSLSNKPSEDHIREDAKVGQGSVHAVAKSQPITNNLLLEQGKTYFKDGDFTSALKTFHRGRQQQPKNLQFTYNIALVYLKTHQYQQGLNMLQQIIQSDPAYKKTVYLFAVISLKNLNMLQEAISMADKGLGVFQNFIDLLFYRGKLFKQVGNVDGGLADMQRVLSVQKDHVEALYYSAYFYFSKRLSTHAMSALSSAIYYDQNKQSQMRVQGLKLRAKIYIMEGKMKQAKKDIQKVIQKSSNSAETYYLMGKVLIQQNNVTDALINFQKCLRQKSKTPNICLKSATLFTPTNPNNYLIPSLLQICKTKILMKDFYSAYHHINRSKHLSQRINQEDFSLLRFRYFIEGVVFLMKRKIDQGMRNFQRFIQLQNLLRQKLTNSQRVIATSAQNKTHTQSQTATLSQHHTFNPTQLFQSSQLTKQLQYFYPSFYLYRGFGYFMQNNHQLAIKDYQQYEKYYPLDKYMMYNLYLARGISKVAGSEFAEGIEFFNKAGGLFVKGDIKKIQPYIYRAIASIQTARNITTIANHNNLSPQVIKPQDDNQIRVLELVFQALKQLDKAYDINQGNSNLLFIRSLIYSYLNKYQQSLDDIIKGISKSQQNVPKYFFFRGLIQWTMENKKQALNDFNIAVNLDSTYAQVYLQRAKLNFQLEHYSKGFHDLDKYVELKPQEDVELHKAAMYFVNGVYPLAEQASELVKDKQTPIYTQLSFHIMLNRGKLRQAEQLITHDNQTDKLLLKIIQTDDTHQPTTTPTNLSTAISDNLQLSNLHYFNRVQYYHFLGVAYFNSGQYQRALDEFSIALKQANLKELENSSGGFGYNRRRNLTSEEGEQGGHGGRNLGDRDANCIVYNIFLCHLKLGDLRKAYQIFITQIMPVDQKLQKSQFMSNFSHLLFQAMKKSSSSSSKANNTTKRQPTEDIQQAHVQLFSNTMTEMFSKEIIIDMSTFLLRTKLSYLNVQCERLKREYSGRLYPQYVLQWLNVREVQNRPQPPWVRRQSGDQGLVFTDCMQDISIEFQITQHDDDQQSDNHEQQQQQQQQQGDTNQQQYQMDNNQSQLQNNNSSGQLQKRFDPKRFRDQMKLGDSIQRKLNKIVNKNHHQQQQV